ncbi:MAG: TetR family transcriptional regulator [Ponticaulis sp.]|nr:TetR family transcriptional regulator [Ponticaulis sp.]|tara:strand:- start:75748 stop:76365 length:618 start_codon:yes stop_codon:yes gene_type:complete
MNFRRKTSYHHGDLRAALLETAEAELTEYGLEAFSLRRVTTALGVTPAAPSYHFGNTDGLLTELAALGFERMLLAQKTRQQGAETEPKAQLVASGIGYIEFAVDNPNLFQLMFGWKKLDKDSTALNAARRAAYNHLVSNVEEIHSTTERTTKDVMTDAMAAWVTVHGIASLVTAGKTNQLSALESVSNKDRDTLIGELILRAISR